MQVSALPASAKIYSANRQLYPLSRSGQFWRIVLATVSVAALAACGGGDKTATQTAVKVNKDEITVHQINFVLQQQRGLTPDQAEGASRQVLERLIDQQLALQRAEEIKLDRDPRVVQMVEAAKREVLARAYAEKIGEAAIKPTAEEIKLYYEEKPALFKERRIYSLQEIGIEAKPEQIPELRAKLAEVKNVTEFVDYLKSAGYKFNGNQAVRAAEQLPLNSLDAFAKMKDGQAALLPTANGAQVIVLAGSRSQPVGEEQARPAIEAFLLNERKRKVIEEETKNLRSGAKIEYLGKFAETAASAPTSVAAPAAAVAPAASGSLSDTDISKGMGLKK